MSVPRFREYLPTGDPVIPSLPPGWSVVLLRNVGQFLKGRGGSKQDASDSGVPCIRYGELYTTFSYSIRAARSFVPTERAGEYQPIRRGDVLFAASGEDMADIGRSAVNLIDGPTVCGGDIVILRPTVDVLPEFLGFACDSIIAKAQKAMMGRGTTIKHIYPDELRRVVIAIPPRSQQEGIVSFLETETAKIDALIAEQERIAQLLSEKVDSLALDGFSDPGARLLRLDHVAEEISRPVVGETGAVYTRLGLYNRGRGIFHKDAAEADDLGDSDFFWIEDGDLIISGQFAWEGAVALAGPREKGCVVSHRYPVLRGRPRVALTEYLFALLSTDHGNFLLNEHSRGAAGRNRPLNIGSLLKEFVPIPSISKQQAVATAVHERSVLLSYISETRRLLAERRTALITAAVTGQIDVRGLVETAA